MSTLDEVLPHKPGLAPSWGDSLSIRGMRGYIATHTYISNSRVPPEKDWHDFEVTVKVPRPEPDLRICVFLPTREKQKDTNGVVIHYHGGGWSICKPEMEARYGRYMAESLGAMVLAPDYAKAPEHPHPAAIRQSYALLKLLASPLESETSCLAKLLGEAMPAEKHRFGFDSRKITLTGGSSGGNIACALTLLTQELPLGNDTRIVALGLQYPGVNLAMPYQSKLESLEDQSMIVPPPWASRLFLRCYLPGPFSSDEARENKFVSPGLAEDEDIRQFPPTCIVTAQYDHYRLESLAFADRLKKLGVDCDLTVCDGVAHAYDTAPCNDVNRKDLNDKARELSWKTVAAHLSKHL